MRCIKSHPQNICHAAEAGVHFQNDTLEKLTQGARVAEVTSLNHAMVVEQIMVAESRMYMSEARYEEIDSPVHTCSQSILSA